MADELAPRPTIDVAAAALAPWRRFGVGGEFARGFAVVLYRDVMRLVQSRGNLFNSLFQPLLFFVIFGAGLHRTVGTMGAGVGFAQFLFPGMIAQTVFMSSINAGSAVARDREIGFLRELLVAPVSRAGILAGALAGRAILASYRAAAMACIAPFLHVHLTVAMVLGLGPLLLLISLLFSSLSILLACTINPRQRFEQILQFTSLPLVLISGTFFPLNAAPPWLALTAKLNPLTYGVDAVRHLFLAVGGGAGRPALPFDLVWFGHVMSVGEDAAVLAVLSAALFAATHWAFTRTE